MFRSIVKTLDKSSNLILYVQCRTAKTEIPIKWTRPEKVPIYKAEKAGDLKPLKEIDLKKIPALYQKSTELQTANELVKRLFTLEFQNKHNIIKAMRNDYMEDVIRHDLDSKSLEAKIAAMTASIRHLQIYMDVPTVRRKPRNVRVYIKEAVEKRRKFLKILRKVDYKRFEWLLDKLDLVYKPRPELPSKVFRKDSIRKLTDKYCDSVRQEKMNRLREYFESQQEEFLTKKLETLKSIQEKEKAIGVELSVSDEQIVSVNKKLEEVKARKKDTEVD